MNSLSRKSCSLTALLLALIFLLTGCWDNQDLEKIFIAVGAALDKSEQPGEIDVAFQVGENNSSPSQSSGGDSAEQPGLVLKKSGRTLAEALSSLDRDNDRSLLLQHNQVVLVGKELAEQGIKEHLDLIFRSREARIEILLMVVDGRGDELLSASLPPEDNTGIYIFRMMQNLQTETPHHRVRIVDFASRLRDGVSSPVIPMIKLVDQDDRQTLELAGMAVFKQDKMIETLDQKETLGFLWAMGDVERSGVAVESEQGRVVFRIQRMKTKRKVTLKPDGSVGLSFEVDARLELEEMRGFEDVQIHEQVALLIKLGQEQIRKQIVETFQVSQEMNADIYALGMSVYRKYPKEWKDMKDRWDEIYAEIEPEVKVTAKVPSLGQMVKSLEMEDIRF